jgi:hypothetical protein
MRSDFKTITIECPKLAACIFFRSVDEFAV